ncbi:hypothetical protein [Aeropyrum camini]|uniref:Predicted transcriptional regulator n=1 Tax=Aeropyrum camini SY1 = JCM 12091 TaxID=1198449 RepID=U3TB51_9CREN|nr:hypothetical protein [Aeropyrum camini]BAN90767.1 predicted transcriptional regulator [Aeropyrum camini SY1 = JCM 12091]
MPEFEILESYVLFGERRFRVRERGSGIVFNVAASNDEEALNKAREMFKRIKADRVLKP